MNFHIKMKTFLAFSCLCILLVSTKGNPYGSINDLYDTNYEYEFGDFQSREEVLVTNTPKFLSQPLELVVNTGHTISLPCLVDQLEGFVLLWRKDERIISVGDQIIDKLESRIQLKKVKNGNTLVIGLADNSDEAEYVCSVSAYRKTEIRHTVRIRVEPVITTSPQEPLTLPEGSSATLSCQLLSGSPIPSLKWRKCDDKHISHGEVEISKDVIKFEFVTRDDGGCYVCEADNGFAEEPVTSKAILIVEYPPSVHIQKTEDSTEVLTITCTVESNPRAEVTWFKDGEEIVNASKNLIIHKGSARNNLNLVALDEEDFGNYNCLAENKLGMDTDSVRIAGKEHSEKMYENIDPTTISPVNTSIKLVSTEKGIKAPLETTFSGKLTNGEEHVELSKRTRNIVNVSLQRKYNDKFIQNYVNKEPYMNTQAGQHEVAIRNHPIKTTIRKDFLNLLRVYRFHKSSSSDNQVEHKTMLPQSNLLRSTHSYGSVLSAIGNNEEESNGKRLNPGNAKEKGIVPRAGENKKMKNEKEDNVPESFHYGRYLEEKEITDSLIMGRYLDEKETSPKNVIETSNEVLNKTKFMQNLQGSNSSSCILGLGCSSVSLLNSIKELEPNSTNKAKIDETVEQKEEFHDKVKTDVETNDNDRYTEEEEIMGGRYIIGNKLKEYSTEISMDSPEINANDLRGQYFLNSSLEDSNQSREFETETGAVNRKQNEENIENRESKLVEVKNHMNLENNKYTEEESQTDDVSMNRKKYSSKQTNGPHPFRSIIFRLPESHVMPSFTRINPEAKK